MDAVWKRRGERWTRGRRVSKRSLDGEDGKGATTGRCAAKAVRREVVSAEVKMYVRVWLARLNLSLEGVEKRKRKEKGKKYNKLELNTAGNFVEHRDRSRNQHRSNRRRKNYCRFLSENIGRASKKLFGPRKPRCVDFFMQTYSERYDFFDRFRSFSSTAIDRGIGIGRFGVEKTTFDFLKKM